MAVYSISDMGASFSTVYRKKVSQTQRKTPTARVLAALGSFKQGNTGQTINWTPKFQGQVAGNANLDGGAFLTPASDQPAPAQTVYGTQEAPARVTDDMLWKGGVSAGIPAEFNTFADPYMEARVDALEALLKLTNQQIYTGTGTSNQMVGLSTAVAATGIYANVNQSTFAQWASTVQLAGGVLRSLTIGLLKNHLRTVAAVSKAGRPNIGFCTGAIMDAIEALFDPFLMLPQATMPTGAPSREVAIRNPGNIRTIGGDINMDGFRVLYWQTGGVYFVEDPDCQNTAVTNPTNGIFFLNSNEIDLWFLPPPGPRYAAQDVQAVQAVEQDLGPIANWQLESIPRGRIDHAMQWDLTGKLGLKLTSRNAHGWLGDIQ